MHVFALIFGGLILVTILWDAFETVALPRTAMRKMRLARLFYRSTWGPWVAVARLIGPARRRDAFLALYGPLSVFGLLMVWAIGVVIGFALLLWSQRALVSTLPGDSRLFDLVYLSGSTLFTLGSADLAPHNEVGRVLTVVEAGIGLGLLSLVLSYLPVLYGSFSRREVRLTLLDTWAGSPPSAAELLRRLATTGDPATLSEFLKEWEYWCSELLESHISYPPVAYFRSQHRHQSWVSALATVLDLSALLKVGVDGFQTWRAHQTFAIARHAAVDLAQILGGPPDTTVDRLPREALVALRRDLGRAGLTFEDSADADDQLAELRRSYEPYILALANRLKTPAPPWLHTTSVRHNWQTNPRHDGGAHL
jgi:Ion channel